MSSKTYKVRGIVLKKTKLGEKDLIVTMVDERGMLVRGVAKGARKPGGSFAARLELFSEVDALMAKGRSLDVVCDVRLVGPPASTVSTIEQSSCAAPLAELLCAISQPDLPQPRVYEISRAAFGHMLSPDRSDGEVLAVLPAALWKVLSQSGFRPSFSRCSICGSPFDSPSAPDSNMVALSVGDGGVVCDGCRRPADAFMVEAGAIRWCEALIMMTFDDVVSSGIDAAICFSVLQIARQWARAHAGAGLKSLDFLFTSGLFR